MKQLPVFKFAAAVLALGSVFVAANVQAADYTIDPNHSSASFTVRHMAGKVHGRFNTLKGEFSYDPNNLKTAGGSVEIDAASIDTNVVKRDNHLRSADFFDVENHKTINFVIKSAEQKGAALIIKGDLTLRGVTKPVVLTGSYLGEAKDPWGNKAISFEATTTINRKDYGLNWNKVLETGGFLVGDNVEIEINVEANPKVVAEVTAKPAK